MGIRRAETSSHDSKPTSWRTPRLVTVAVLVVLACSQDQALQRKGPQDMQTDSDRSRVREWLMKAPFDDPRALAAQPDFSYEDWFNEGRALPYRVEVLTELLEREDLQQPSGDG